MIGDKIVAETVIRWSNNPVYAALESKHGMGRSREGCFAVFAAAPHKSTLPCSNLAHPALKPKL